MTGSGTIVSVSGEYADVRITKFTSCSHNCAECSACTVPSYVTKVKNKVGACVGDMVIIENSSFEILSAALIMYIVPVIIVILGVSAFDASAISGISAFVFVAFAIAVWIAAVIRINKKMKISGVAVKIVGKDDKLK